MWKVTKAFSGILFLIILYLPLFTHALQNSIASRSQEELSSAASIVDHPPVRTINAHTLNELRSDSAMDYYFTNPDNNLWQMFRYWIFRQLVDLFGNTGAAGSIEIIIYALGLLAIAYALLRLFKVDLSGLIGRNSGRKQIVTEGENSHEDINEMDFGAALAEALKANEYNKAIRLLYLSALKELTVREHIHWLPGKTNYQYQQELKAAHLQSPFQQLGYYFEYAWYGNFQIGEFHFKEAERSFQSLHQNLQKRP